MNINYLNEIRLQEVEDILKKHKEIFQEKKVLEIGAGTGIQASVLRQVSAEVLSLEIEETNYREYVPSHITFYDGHHIPFPDNYFDVVYSSNVLEHIAHRDEFQKEIMRVLKKDGYALHIMPTHWWRLREMLQNLILFPPRLVKYLLALIKGKTAPALSLPELIFGQKHGEFGGVFTEVYYFLPEIWIKNFRKVGWHVESSYSTGLFYTGRLWFGAKLSWGIRRLLSKYLGSSGNIYLLRKK